MSKSVVKREYIKGVMVGPVFVPTVFGFQSGSDVAPVAVDTAEQGSEEVEVKWGSGVATKQSAEHVLVRVFWSHLPVATNWKRPASICNWLLDEVAEEDGVAPLTVYNVPVTAVEVEEDKASCSVMELSTGKQVVYVAKVHRPVCERQAVTVAKYYYPEDKPLSDEDIRALGFEGGVATGAKEGIERGMLRVAASSLATASSLLPSVGCRRRAAWVLSLITGLVAVVGIAGIVAALMLRRHFRAPSIQGGLEAEGERLPGLAQRWGLGGVAIVDHRAGVRRQLLTSLRGYGLATYPFCFAGEFVEAADVQQFDCALVQVRRLGDARLLGALTKISAKTRVVAVMSGENYSVTQVLAGISNVVTVVDERFCTNKILFDALGVRAAKAEPGACAR